MTDSVFDPYHIWLSIPAAEQPPHHYRLLGLELFESNSEVIDVASNRMRSFVRTEATGKYVEVGKRILEQIDEARKVLLNSSSRAEYDDVLRQAGWQSEHDQPRESSSDDFDALHLWLGIPPGLQPPTHYRLLGLSAFESNPDVIAKAASRQASYLQTTTTGEHVRESQKLLTDIATAKRCLIDADRRAAYDASLLETRSATESRVEESVTQNQPRETTTVADTENQESKPERRRKQQAAQSQRESSESLPLIDSSEEGGTVRQRLDDSRNRQRKNTTIIAGTVIGLLVCVGIYIAIPSGSGGTSETADVDSKTPSADSSDSMPDAPAPEPGFLLNVAERSVYNDSPVQTSNQWQYARIAKSYPGEAGNFVLLAGNAEVLDENGATPQPAPDAIRYRADTDAVAWWLKVGSSTNWRLGKALMTGDYRVIAHYGADQECDGNEFELTLGDRKLTHRVEPTGGYSTFTAHELGELTMFEGEEYELSMVATRLNDGSGLLDLRAVELVPAASVHRWFDVVTGKWRRDIPASMRYPGKVCDQAPPAHLIKGGPKGFAVITTNAIRDHSEVLADFVSHKERLGYKPMLITEDDFGGGTGPDAADNIRNWLHENYKQRRLLYVLFIGNPNPGHGEIPMYPLATNLKEFREALARGEHPHAGRPSDSPYADCSGSTIDINGDHIVDEYEAGKGLDAAWDVLVGRIPYYGEDSKWGRYADVDAILQKTIDYDNASPDEILERYKFEVDGNVLDGYVVEWAGFPYLTREQSHRGRLTLDHFSWQNNSFMDQYNVGFIRSGGHANPTFIESGVTSGWLANRVAPDATCQVVAEYGGCDCLQPEHPMNMGYMHLRKGAITAVGASRSIASATGVGGLVRPAAFHSIRRTPLMRGISVGQAHWQGLTAGRQRPNGGAQMWTLYGDPSVVPFPEKMHPRRQHALRPVHNLEHFEPLTVDSSAPLHKQEYDLQNLSGKPLNWSVSHESDWIELSETSSVLKPGEIATVKLGFNNRSRELPAGMKRATLTFQIGDQTERRTIEFVRTTPKVTHRITFDDKPDGMFVGKRDGQHTVFDRFGADNFVNRTISLEIKPNESLPGNATIAAGERFRLFVHPDQSVELNWNPYPYGEQSWSQRFGAMTTAPEDSLMLRTTQGLISGQANRIAITTDFLSDKATLFLNGQEQATGKMNGRLFLPWKTSIGHNLNAAVDNIIVETSTASAADEAATFANGFPASSPSPEVMQSGVNRTPVLKWDVLPSHNAIPEPNYEVHIGPTADALALAGSTTSREFTMPNELPASQRHFWRVDVVSADGNRRRSGDVWEFTTGRYISREVIPFPSFSSSDKWQSKWPEVGREPNGVIVFRGFGHNISQKLDHTLLQAGGYRLTLHADCRDQKQTRPMTFILFGRDQAGVDTEFFSKTVELNDLADGTVETYFELKESLSDASEVFCKLQIPVTGTIGHRSPYWVFGTKLSLFNNVDLSSIPNRPPRFIDRTVQLPKMTAKDNSYDYTFADNVEDEKAESLKFRKLEGPEWVTVHESGRVFSPYGAPVSALGQHRLKVEVVDDEGLSDAMTVTLDVRIPGEMTLSATDATLSKGNEIRFTGNLITHITRDDATATWTFTPIASGEYEIVFYAGSPDNNIARVTINGVSREFPIKRTGGNYRNMQPQSAGVFKLAKGEPTEMTLGVVERVDGLCDVSHVHLLPKIESLSD